MSEKNVSVALRRAKRSQDSRTGRPSVRTPHTASHLRTGYLCRWRQGSGVSFHRGQRSAWRNGGNVEAAKKVGALLPSALKLLA